LFVFSKSDVHALRALVALAQLPPGTYRGAVAIARQTGAPRNYLGKLLQMLARRGLVESQKGLGGGFKLARQPHAISLFDVVEAIEDTRRWNACILGNPSCSERSPCSVHSRWSPIREAYLDMMKRTTIAELTPKARRRTA
jgi:Rrf2 family iron-sulfur cluster assembly transcriptional regulator